LITVVFREIALPIIMIYVLILPVLSIFLPIKKLFFNYTFSIKEIIYHLRHSSKWVLRLGDGTAESHKKAQFAIDELWMFTGELFQMNQNELEMVDKGIGVDCSNLKANWMENITKIINMATLSIPGDEYMQSGGREGIHTEHLGHMLSDMQYLQRAYPGAEW